MRARIATWPMRINEHSTFKQAEIDSLAPLACSAITSLVPIDLDEATQIAKLPTPVSLGTLAILSRSTLACVTPCLAS